VLETVDDSIVKIESRLGECGGDSDISNRDGRAPEKGVLSFYFSDNPLLLILPGIKFAPPVCFIINLNTNF